MKNIPFLLALVFANIMLVSSCCMDGDCETEPVRSYNFEVTRNGSTLTGASVTIQTNFDYYSATTDNNGKCSIKIPNEVSLPTYVIATVDHGSIRPKAFSVSGSADASGDKAVSCQSLPSEVLVKEVALHHLGNDQYDGSANSQHQLSTEGIERSFEFYLSSIPSTMPYIQVYARGIEHPTEIIINGITTDKLGDSYADGDLSYWDAQLTANPSTVFQVGYNTITIKAGANNASDPWDDIEFCGLMLYYP